MNQNYRVFFKFSAHYHTKKVEVVGDINNWQPGELMLEDNDGDNIWWGQAVLPSGTYQYKYLVDGVHYSLDPFQPVVRDNHGNENSLLEVGKARLKEDFIHKNDDIDFYSEHCFYMRAALKKCKYTGARLIVVVDDFINTVCGYELFADEVYIYMIFKLENGYTVAQNLLYYFELDRLDGRHDYYGKNGLVNSEWEVENFEYHKPQDGTFITPDWVKDAIFYQIFPERFHNGNPALNPKNTAPVETPPKWDTFYGGDLEGVMQKVDYLKELGINAIYFNPIFEALSTHKYDTADYQKIDPHFGNDKTFRQLGDVLHENGIRFILDGVFNHTGTHFWAFRDIETKKEKSPYIDWYTVKKFPLVENGKPNYECWWNFPSLPELNVDNPKVKKHLLKVAEEWIEKGADGWRLDVPNEIEHDYWKEFRKVVKEANPDAYIVGEIWQSGLPWLKGDEFDAVMNYRFRDACVEFFAQKKIDAEEFVKQIGSQIFDYPMQSNFAMLNLLSSHDTARYLWVAGNDISPVRLAVAFQFAYIGSPCVYYGEEVGMDGGKDPDNRRFMIWNKQKWNMDLYDTYHRLIQIRRENEVLRRGDIRFFYTHNNTIGFERFLGDQRLYIFINNSTDNVCIDVTQYAGNGDFIDIFKNYPLKRKRAYTLYANDFAILKKVKERE